MLDASADAELIAYAKEGNICFTDKANHPLLFPKCCATVTQLGTLRIQKCGRINMLQCSLCDIFMFWCTLMLKTGATHQLTAQTSSDTCSWTAREACHRRMASNRKI